jgi:hypothetical protein
LAFGVGRDKLEMSRVETKDLERLLEWMYPFSPPKKVVSFFRSTGIDTIQKN